MENTSMRNMNGTLFEHGNIGRLSVTIDFCNGILKKTVKLKKKSITYDLIFFLLATFIYLHDCHTRRRSFKFGMENLSISKNNFWRKSC
jgi:hypothetical protein